MSVSRIYRLLRLITMLQTGRTYTADELARQLEVSRRTIFRDLNMLEMAHIPYYFDQEKGGYQISGHFFLPPVNLTVSEALAILMLTHRIKGAASRLPLLAESSRAAMKLENVLPQAIRRHVGSMIKKLSVSFGPVSRHEGVDDMFNELVGAIVRRRICRLVYLSFQLRRQLIVSVRPLRLVFLGRAWYLIAYAVKPRDIRTFKLGRIRKLTVTDRTFQQPTDVDLDEYFGDAWSMIPEGRRYDVHLHFEPKVAGNVAEVQWHHSQRVEWNDDGSIEFYVHVDGLGEITWWVLGYGDQVEIISPAAFRTRVANVAAAVLKKYRKGRK
ncbi:MAG: WYL domain-containing protein [Planctomycetota bacterium]|nr:WYL domain-containing protein [Planctomycetota bacterium]